ncbi:MarR family winged helix-turn-helix transcriptional regulator [Saccharolobus islandicus]|uniref:Putative MarR family transcriptional regulator n=1 Tax=Saccharolobus islandicus LAL14/1 TaxID=1241935 RepID=M9U4D4_SACIS|nr:MarR family transcriptional regulator [Sulfolobus islandicus]AGJ61879.1 Putative MarR family transcriptional regulator [Sulfolobus islandicus LAL14/1]
MKEIESKELEVLRIMSIIYKEINREALKRIGEDLSPLDVGIIKTLSISPYTPAKIASILGVSKSAMTYAVDRLEKLGLVVRTRSEKDRRVIQLELTEKGKEILLKAEKIYSEVTREKLNVLSEEEISTLIQILQKLVSH